MIATTAGRPKEQSEQLAERISRELDIPFVPRNKCSVQQLIDDYNADVLVAGNDRIELYKKGMKKPFFFHPNTAAFRLKRLRQGETEPLIEVSQLQPGMSFLDCTFGFGADSIVASYVVGENGRVMGVEADRGIAYVVSYGLQHYVTVDEGLRQSMQHISIMHADAISFLQSQPDQSWDVVYVDPMFTESVEESTNFSSLREAGQHHLLTAEWVQEAYRVCRQRVVLKAHFRSTAFEQFHFQRNIRPNTKFHFGFLEK